MLNWSDTAYKMTLGVVALAIAGSLAELWGETLPFWAILIIAIIPLALFVFADPEDLPVGFVRIAHAAGSIWYAIVAFGTVFFAMMFMARPLPRGWLVFFLSILIGAIPCSIVLFRVTRGTYLLKKKLRYEIIAPPTEGWDGILVMKQLPDSVDSESEGESSASKPLDDVTSTSKR